MCGPTPDRASVMPLNRRRGIEASTEPLCTHPASVVTVVQITECIAGSRRVKLPIERIAQSIPTNHSRYFAPVLDPTLTTGVETLVAAALTWLAR